MDGTSKYALVIKKLASSPAQSELLVKQRKPSFKRQTSTASNGPSKKESKTINTLPKSSLRKLAPKSGKGISKKLTTYASAKNTAITDMRFAEKRFLRLERVPAPCVLCICSFVCITTPTIKIPRIFGAEVTKENGRKR